MSKKHPKTWLKTARECAVCKCVFHKVRRVKNKLNFCSSNCYYLFFNGSKSKINKQELREDRLYDEAIELMFFDSEHFDTTEDYEETFECIMRELKLVGELKTSAAAYELRWKNSNKLRKINQVLINH